MGIGNRAWILLVAAALAGCFESDEPLIASNESVAPLADGEYTGGDNRVIVTHAGNVMRFTVDGDDGPETSDVLAAPLGEGFYVLMTRSSPDESYEYSLARVADSRLTVYGGDDCGRLKELWLGGGRAPADVGITAISGTIIPTCKFARYYDLARAFRALIAEDRLEPFVVLERVPAN